MGRICHSPGNIDIKLGELLGMSPRLAAALRGAYDTEMSNQGKPALDITEADLDNQEKLFEARRSLMQFRRGMRQTQHAAINESIKHMSEALKTLKRAFTAEQRVNRVNMLATDFSYFLDELQKRYPEATRTELCNGYKNKDGVTVGGENSIFVMIYERWLEKYSTAMTKENPDIEYAKKIEALLDNWSAIVPYVRAVIRQSESIKLGNFTEFATDAEASDFEDNMLSDLYNPEESTKEGWMDIDELKSAFASIGKAVRRTIAETYLYEGEEKKQQDLAIMHSNASRMRQRGVPEERINAYIDMATRTAGYKVDDMGYLVRMNPVSTHQRLLEATKGSVNTSHMLRKLDKAVDRGEEWLKPLVDKIKGSETLKTQFRNDLHKNFQLYSTISIGISEGFKTFRSTIKNNRKNALKDQFYTRALLGQQVQNISGDLESVYDIEGNIIWENLNRTINAIKDMLYSDEDRNPSEGSSENVFEDKRRGQSNVKFFSTKVSKLNKINFLRSTLRSLGIEVSNSTLETVLNDAYARGTIINALKQMVRFGYEGNALSPQIKKALQKGDFEFLRSQKQNYSNLITTMKDNKAGVIQEKLNKILGVLSDKSDAYTVESRVTHKDRKGKTNSLSSFINPCYLGDFVERINGFASERDVTGLREFLENKFGKSSYYAYRDSETGKLIFRNKWLNELYNSKPETVEKSFAALFKYKRFLGTASQNFEDFTSKQHTMDMITEFSFAENETLDKNHRMAWYPVFITGDSGVQRYLEAPVYSKDEVLNGLYDVYLQEIERWKLTRGANLKLMTPDNAAIDRDQQPIQVEVDGDIKFVKDGAKIDFGEGTVTNPDVVYDITTGKYIVKNESVVLNPKYNTIENFSDRAEKFTMLPFLNEDFVASDGEKGKYFSIMEASRETNLEKGVKDAIDAYMSDAMSTFKHQLQEMGLLERQVKVNKEGKVISKKYVYFQDFINKFINQRGNRDLSEEEALDKFLESFYYNTKFATIQQLQIMTVDPAFYVDTKDLQKRYKEIHAPGTTIDIEAIDEFASEPNTRYSDGIERCIYFDDIKVDASKSNPDFMKAIEKRFGKDSRYAAYLKNTLTDGQGYRTLESYRKVMGMAGKWDAECQRAYERIKALRAQIGKGNPTKEQLEELSEISIVFQPLKPYLFTLEQLQVNASEGGTLDIPVQHKYAEAVLIPELLPAGSKLRSMALYMEDHNIDLVCSTKVVKVGSFGSVNISHVENEEQLHSALGTAYVHNLSYEDYRIQTNVPDHFNNQSQLFGTQIRKLILSGLHLNSSDPAYNHYKDYVDFVDAKGNHSRQVNLGGNTGMVELNGMNLVRFYNELITSNIQDCYKIFSDAIGEIEGLSELLTQSIINNEREALDNIIAFSLTGDGNFLVPLFEGATEHDAAALILSKFKKKVNKQTIHGGSAVQVSAFGIEGYDEDNSLQYVCEYDEKGEPTNVLYAECEVPFDITVYDENGRPIQLQFTDYCNPDGTLIMDGGTSKLEKEYPGILDMIAYRIPTERAYSMINLKIKRFSHKIAGGTLKVPAQGTTIAGFDFDIDKLYFMRKCFKRKSMELSDEDTQKVWKYAYEHEPRVLAALQAARADWNDEGYDKLIKGMFRLSDDEWNGIKSSEEKDRLYKFWEEAGLEGTPQDFFNKYRDAALGNREKFVTYDPTKTPWENSKIARDNMLIDLMRARLMDPETFESRYTPQSFANSSRAARFMRELQFGDLNSIADANGNVNFSEIEGRLDDKASDPEPNYDPSDPMTIITYNQQNQVAGKLIGIFANQNANHALSTLMFKLKLNRSGQKYPLGFCGHTYDDLLHCSNPDVNVDNNVAEFLAASVDAVKDPVLNFLNLNTLTADAGAVLVRLGYTPQEVGLLFNQPVIKAICEDCFNNNSNQISEAINTFINTYSKALYDRFGEQYVYDPSADGHLTQEVLAKDIVLDRKARANNEDLLETGSRNYLYNQIKVMEQFKSALELSTAVTDFVRVTRFTAANSVGSTLGNIYAQQLAVDKYVQDLHNAPAQNKILDMAVTPRIAYPIHNTSDSFKEGAEYMATLFDNPFAYEQCMFDMNRRVLRDLSKYFPYETKAYTTARNLMAKLCNWGTLDEETINDLHSDLLIYMMNHELEGSIFDGRTEKEVGGKKYSSSEYYNTVFPRNLVPTINRLKNAVPIFGAMSYKSVKPVKSKEGGEVIVLSLEDSGAMQGFQSDAIRESWEDLYFGRYDEFMVGSKEEQKQLAIDLFLYNYYKSGFSYTPFSFIHLAPAELKASLECYPGEENSITYADFLQDVLTGKLLTDSDMQEFAVRFIQNHVDNNRLAYTLRPGSTLYKSFNANVKVRTASGIMNNNFIVDLNRFEDSEKNFLTIKDPTLKERVAFKPCIIIDNVVYMAVGAGQEQFNVSANNTMEYQKVGEVSDFNPEDVRNRTLDYTLDTDIADDSKSPAPADSETPTMPVGNSSIEPAPVLPENPVPNEINDAIIDEIATEMAKARIVAGFDSEENYDSSVKEFKEVLRGLKKDDLEATINIYRNAQRNSKGYLVLDENGDMIEIC